MELVDLLIGVSRLGRLGSGADWSETVKALRWSIGFVLLCAGLAFVLETVGLAVYSLKGGF